MRSVSRWGVIVTIGVGPISVAADWEFAIEANLLATQNAYSSNWAGGEAGAASWAFNSRSLAERQLTGRVHNKNTLNVSFGQTYTQNREDRSWSEPATSTDLIDVESIFRVTLGRLVDPFVSGRMETQFVDKRELGTNRYINPLRFTESIGAAKVFMKKEDREWSGRLGITARQYIDRDVLIVHPLDIMPHAYRRETKVSTDFGVQFVTDFRTLLAHSQITVVSRLVLFQAFLYSEADELEGLFDEDYWKSPDVNWENTLTGRITDYLMVNLYIQLLYDREIDPGVRFKQTLSLGLVYTLASRETEK